MSQKNEGPPRGHRKVPSPYFEAGRPSQQRPSVFDRLGVRREESDSPSRNRRRESVEEKSSQHGGLRVSSTGETHTCRRDDHSSKRKREKSKQKPSKVKSQDKGRSNSASKREKQLRERSKDKKRGKSSQTKKPKKVKSSSSSGSISSASSSSISGRVHSSSESTSSSSTDSSSDSSIPSIKLSSRSTKKPKGPTSSFDRDIEKVNKAKKDFVDTPSHPPPSTSSSFGRKDSREIFVSELGHQQHEDNRRPFGSRDGLNKEPYQQQQRRDDRFRSHQEYSSPMPRPPFNPQGFRGGGYSGRGRGTDFRRESNLIANLRELAEPKGMHSRNFSPGPGHSRPPLDRRVPPDNRFPPGSCRHFGGPDHYPTQDFMGKRRGHPGGPGPGHPRGSGPGHLGRPGPGHLGGPGPGHPGGPGPGHPGGPGTGHCGHLGGPGPALRSPLSITTGGDRGFDKSPKMKHSPLIPKSKEALREKYEAHSRVELWVDKTRSVTTLASEEDEKSSANVSHESDPKSLLVPDAEPLSDFSDDAEDILKSIQPELRKGDPPPETDLTKTPGNYEDVDVGNEDVSTPEDWDAENADDENREGFKNETEDKMEIEIENQMDTEKDNDNESTGEIVPPFDEPFDVDRDHDHEVQSFLAANLDEMEESQKNQMDTKSEHSMDDEMRNMVFEEISDEDFGESSDSKPKLRDALEVDWSSLLNRGKHENVNIRKRKVRPKSYRWSTPRFFLRYGLVKSLCTPQHVEQITAMCYEELKKEYENPPTMSEVQDFVFRKGVDVERPPNAFFRYTQNPHRHALSLWEHVGIRNEMRYRARVDDKHKFVKPGSLSVDKSIKPDSDPLDDNDKSANPESLDVDVKIDVRAEDSEEPQLPTSEHEIKPEDEDVDNISTNEVATDHQTDNLASN